MNIRKLKFKDTFKVARIIKSANLKDSVLSGYQVLNEEDGDVEYQGINLFFDIISGISDERTEKEIYALIEDIADIEDASEMDFIELEEFIKTVIKENNIANFITAVKNQMK